MTDPIAALLQPIKARLEAASAGPWAVEADEDGADGYSVYLNDGIMWGRAYVCTDIHQGVDDGKSDAEFIAAAPTDQARLIAALEAVLALHQEGLAYCNECDQKWPCETVAALTSALESAA